MSITYITAHKSLKIRILPYTAVILGCFWLFSTFRINNLENRKITKSAFCTICTKSLISQVLPCPRWVQCSLASTSVVQHWSLSPAEAGAIKDRLLTLDIQVHAILTWYDTNKIETFTADPAGLESCWLLCQSLVLSSLSLTGSRTICTSRIRICISEIHYTNSWASCTIKLHQMF